MLCIALLSCLAVSATYFIICLRRERKKYRELLKYGNVRYELLLSEYEEKLKNKIVEEKERQIREAASMTHHLSNVISGMNHELSPWIGGIKNKISRLTSKSRSSIISLPEIAMKLTDIIKACDSMSLILDNLSKDVKKVQNYDIYNSNILETIVSWVRLTISDRSIKENISEENFIIDKTTLNFSCDHSPLLVSQVILNLVKNSIDHNGNMLESLKIRISGDIKNKCLIYEDNGKGIPDKNLSAIFTPGVTTKNFEKEIHGLGLSLCQDYCSTMNAVIVAESSKFGARFVISFESDFVKSDRESSIRLSCKLGTEHRG